MSGLLVAYRFHCPLGVLAQKATQNDHMTTPITSHKLRESNRVGGAPCRSLTGKDDPAAVNADFNGFKTQRRFRC